MKASYCDNHAQDTLSTRKISSYLIMNCESLYAAIKNWDGSANNEGQLLGESRLRRCRCSQQWIRLGSVLLDSMCNCYKHFIVIGMYDKARLPPETCEWYHWTTWTASRSVQLLKSEMGRQIMKDSYWESHACDAVDAPNNESDLGLCC